MENKKIIHDAAQIIKKTKWTFAKTYADKWPHEWACRNEMAEDDYLTLCEAVLDYGTVGRFYRYTNKYLLVDGMIYWVMTDKGTDYKTDKTGIINRCPVGMGYESRLRLRMLPESELWLVVLDALKSRGDYGRIPLMESYERVEMFFVEE